MRLILPILILFALASGGARAVEDETLIVEVPKGYKIEYQAKQNNVAISEFVPEGQSVKDWTEMVTVQVFFGVKTVTPEQYRARMTQAWGKACENSVSSPITSAVENGYPITLWLSHCPLNKQSGKMEQTYFKAMQGNDSFYLVQKAFRFEPSKEQVVQWTQYLKKVGVCDTRLPERRCPAGMQ